MIRNQGDYKHLDRDMDMTKKVICRQITGVCILSIFVTSAVMAGPIEELQPGHWYKIPNSKMESVEATPPLISQSHYDSLQGNAGVAGVMTKWSGGAYDTTRERLVVWGGGHSGYGGNEVYAFDVNALKWERLTLPSKGPFGQDILSDGRPGSRHTYDALVYLPPPIDRMYARGGGFFPTAYNGISTWLFDFVNKKWERKKDFAELVQSNIADFDPITGLVFEGSINFLRAFDPINNTWTQASNRYPFSADNGNMAMDPIRRKLVRIGNNAVHVWDISRWPNRIPRTNLSAAGGAWIESQSAPGFVYVPPIKKFVAWSGGADVYVLDMDALTWTKVSPAPSNTVIPTQVTAEGGTFGRFQYIPSKGVFIAVNATNEDVYIYRMDSNIAVNVPMKPAKPSVAIK